MRKTSCQGPTNFILNKSLNEVVDNYDYRFPVSEKPGKK